MKIKFKIQQYQTHAVDSVVECFAGQPFSDGVIYRIDPGAGSQTPTLLDEDPEAGFKNADVRLTDKALLDNVRAVQLRQDLRPSAALDRTSGARINLDVEMETGTGKTYVYIKTIFELNKRYGWTKFIVVVPSIAIREGVHKSFELTASHFVEAYGKKARTFVYDSKQLHQLESFSSNPGINVMIINIQAFNSRGADARRIYGTLRRNFRGVEELVGLDDFGSRKPIDVISANRPVLILDEPQKMEGDPKVESATLASLQQFKPLAVLRYSATHRKVRNQVHRLDAVDAYNHKLVKKIAVRGITVRGLAGSSAYLYLDSIEVSTVKPVAWMDVEVKQASGVSVRRRRRVDQGTDLFVTSGGLSAYKDRFTVTDIDAVRGVVEFTNGHQIAVGQATQDVSEAAQRRIQIREAVKAHLDKERQLHDRGIKVLSLFFIDEVAKYRDYGRPDEKGEYARWFEEEYRELVAQRLSELPLGDKDYRAYLDGIDPGVTHSGYFSIDKKTKQLVDPTVKGRGENAGSEDQSAYDLILRDKEGLLSFGQPVRFIFSHSALREGWDNPNVFVMCMLKHSDNTVSRRQEVGRGLRLAVDQHGERIDDPDVVHEVNELTVVASESYAEFVAGLQKEISADLTIRLRKADEAFFVGRVLHTADGDVTVTKPLARAIYKYLLLNDLIDGDDHLAPAYFQARVDGSWPDMPEELMHFGNHVLELVETLTDGAAPVNGHNLRPVPVNHANLERREFVELWNRINRKAHYRVDFDSAELTAKSIAALDRQLKVAPLQYTVQRGALREDVTDVELRSGQGFVLEDTRTERHSGIVTSAVEYDLLGSVAERTALTRRTVAAILQGVRATTFAMFQQNPEHFLTEVARIIDEQKATMIVEHLSYDIGEERYSTDIFTVNQSTQDFSHAGQKLARHVYDYVVTDSEIERNFVTELDASDEVVVYAKLPRGFRIPTPVGNYNPDWAIAFVEDKVKHVYFVAETKGSLSSMQLRGVEQAKIDCARRFFRDLAQKVEGDGAVYDVITNYGDLMDVISR